MALLHEPSTGFVIGRASFFLFLADAPVSSVVAVCALGPYTWLGGPPLEVLWSLGLSSLFCALAALASAARVIRRLFLLALGAPDFFASRLGWLGIW